MIGKYSWVGYATEMVWDEGIVGEGESLKWWEELLAGYDFVVEKYNLSEEEVM